MISASLASLGSRSGTELPVVLSHEIVGLLSEQMYGSPLKAIEEMVVNSYDADAEDCRITVPTHEDEQPYVAIYDNGCGMDEAGLRDLWYIGRSNKRQQQIALSRSRTQIGKFGIGKLAAYALANRSTYISKAGTKILAVTVDFTKFSRSPTGQASELSLPVYRIEDPLSESDHPLLTTIFDALDIDIEHINTQDSWTLVVLEDIKPEVTLHRGRLRWILRTAMPLQIDFNITLNGEAIASSKEDFDTIAEFKVSDLTQDRLDSLRKKNKQDWTIDGDKLISSGFPSGISGDVIVTHKVLRSRKSDDIMRSHGFFIKIRNRLVNEHDARFGLHELSHAVFNRFRADIKADDLDKAITAPREGVGDSPLKDAAQDVLNELFNEARTRYRANQPNMGRKEHTTDYVPRSLLEYPVADALSMSDITTGSEADDTWFYLDEVVAANPGHAIGELYSSRRRDKYTYDYSSSGENDRLVKFNPQLYRFILNLDHEIVRAYGSTGALRFLLEDLATAEAILEIYLREANISPKLVGEILQKRDSLLRSLAQDHMTSPVSISQSLRDASDLDNDLEIALVASARAIGFVAKHLGGPAKPDGIASLIDHTETEERITKKIALEAKSSRGVPSIPTLGMATLAQHVRQSNADGCLLVAPSYPGESRGDEASIADLANSNRVSCWTVSQLADVVDATLTRHISARDVLRIILTKFSPEDVARAVSRLLHEPAWSSRDLCHSIIVALETLFDSVSDARPTADMVVGRLVGHPEFGSPTKEQVVEGLSALASSSQGAMTFRNEVAVIHTSIPELRRRTSLITGAQGEPRRLGQFRSPEAK